MYVDDYSPWPAWALRLRGNNTPATRLLAVFERQARQERGYLAFASFRRAITLVAVEEREMRLLLLPGELIRKQCVPQFPGSGDYYSRASADIGAPAAANPLSSCP